MDPLTITSIFGIGKELIERFFPDPNERAKQMLLLEELKQKGDLAVLEAHVKLLMGQLEVNKVEASHKSLFVAGWRPFIGWACGSAFVYAAILEPIMRFIATMVGYTGEFPVISTDLLNQVLLGMLGLGMMRSFDKKNKTETNSI